VNDRARKAKEEVTTSIKGHDFFQNLFFSTVFCHSLPLSFFCIAMCVLIWVREKKRSGLSEEFLHMPAPPLRPE